MFRENLMKRMEDIGMSQRMLSAEADVSEGTISRYINGSREPKMDVVKKLAKALGVAPSYLMRNPTDSEDKFRTVMAMIEESRDCWTKEEKAMIIDAVNSKKGNAV